MPDLARIGVDAFKMMVTFTLALSTGWLFFLMNLPAPYMMGALFGVWLAGGLIKPLRGYLGVPRWFHVPVILWLSVMIGATFNQAMAQQFVHWWKSIAVMLATTSIVCLTVYCFLHRIRGYEKRLAFFCCLPGGQAEVMALARELVDKDYVVALFHLVRVTIVFVAIPLLLALLQGSEAVTTSNVRLSNMPGIFTLPVSELLLFIFLAVAGLLLALLLRLPLPYLLGPMILSAVLHAIGWADLPRINEFVILAQLSIGGAIGARLTRVRFVEMLGYLKDALMVVAMILGFFLLASVLMAWLDGVEFIEVWLAFMPGGLYEVTLLALIFGFDVAFVSFHHTVRIIPLFFAMSLIGKRLPGEK